MTEKKSFHLGDILSVTTGYMVSKKDGPEGITTVLNFMFNRDFPENVDILSCAAKDCNPYIFRQHPSLAEISTVSLEMDPDRWEVWLERKIAVHGEYLELERIPGC